MWNLSSWRMSRYLRYGCLKNKIWIWAGGQICVHGHYHCFLWFSCRFCEVECHLQCFVLEYHHRKKLRLQTLYIQPTKILRKGTVWTTEIAFIKLQIPLPFNVKTPAPRAPNKSVVESETDGIIPVSKRPFVDWFEVLSLEGVEPPDNSKIVIASIKGCWVTAAEVCCKVLPEVLHLS